MLFVRQYGLEEAIAEVINAAHWAWRHEEAVAAQAGAICKRPTYLTVVPASVT